MTPLELLEKFAEYVEFDPEQTHFTMFSRTYDMHRALKCVPAINEYDPTGAMAVLFVKRAFQHELEKTELTLFDAIISPKLFEEDKAMWGEFESEMVEGIESELVTLTSSLVERATGRKLLGRGEELVGKIADAVEQVVDGMQRCHVHVWSTDKAPLRRPSTLPTTISVFESAAHMVATLSGAPDGLYFAYVQMQHSVDGFFGFFLKSGGSIVSLDDLILESYPHQNEKHRNNNYLRAKAYDFFPYGDVVRFTGSDYKGYATESEVVGREISILSLEEGQYIKMALAMSCLLNLFEGKVYTEGERLYVTSLSPQHLQLAGPSALALKETDAIVVSNDLEGILDLSSEDVLCCKNADGSDSKLAKDVFTLAPFDDADVGKKSSAVSILHGTFELDASKLPKMAESEFIGHRSTLQDVAMMEARQQLGAELMRVFKRQFDDMGGIQGVNDWYHRKCLENIDAIRLKCAAKFLEIQEADGLDEAFKWRFIGCGYHVGADVGMRALWAAKADYDPLIMSFNAVEGKTFKLVGGNGRRCSYSFVFNPYDFEDIAELVGVDDAPELVRCWRASEPMFGYNGNSILDRTDPVGELRNPLSGYTFDAPYLQKRDDDLEVHFRFQVGFTKTEMKRLIQELETAENRRG